jgi:hypothetical protein
MELWLEEVVDIEETVYLQLKENKNGSKSNI